MEKYPSLSVSDSEEMMKTIIKQWNEMNNYYMEHARISAVQLASNCLVSLRVADAFITDRRREMKRIYNRNYRRIYCKRIHEDRQKEQQVLGGVLKRKNGSMKQILKAVQDAKRTNEEANEANEAHRTKSRANDPDDETEDEIDNRILPLNETQIIPNTLVNQAIRQSMEDNLVVTAKNEEVASPNIISTSLVQQLFAPPLFQFLAAEGVLGQSAESTPHDWNIPSLESNRLINIPINMILLHGNYAYIRFFDLLRLLQS
jgi:hypothetical protein